MRVVMAGDYPADLHHITGGVEAVTWNLTQALQHYPDLHIDLITLRKGGHNTETVDHNGVTVHYLPTSRAPGCFSVQANVRRLRAIMCELHPDLIHVHVAGDYAAAAAGTGRPWVLTVHGIRFLEVNLWQGFLNKYYRGWFIKRAERRALQQAKHLISISPFIQTTFTGQIRGAVYAIENPIDESFYTITAQPQPGEILFVGRLIPRKGVHILLRAFAQLHGCRPESRLRLAGGSGFTNEAEGYYAELQQFVQEADLQDAVTFLGAVDKATLRQEYARCAVVVLASRLETAPMALMEAMAAGKAVVSTDVGGARHLVEQGKTGWIVPPNDESALADALAQALSDPTTLRAMGQRARAVAQRTFHADVVAARTRAVYYQILGLSPPAPLPIHH